MSPGRGDLRRPVWPLSQGEVSGHHETFVERLVNRPEDLVSSARSTTTRDEYVQRVLAGGMPIALSRPSGTRRARWFADYVGLVVERDVLDIRRVRQREVLPLLLRRLEAQTAGVLNVSDLARRLDLERTVVEDYVRLLEAVFLVHRLPAWGRTVSSWVDAHSYPMPVDWTPDRIRALRATGLCLSQDEFAIAVGFAKRTIGNAERGVHPPSLALRRALDRALDNASDTQRDRFLATLVDNPAPTQQITASLTPTLDELRRAVLDRPLIDVSAHSDPENATGTMAAITRAHRLYQQADYDAAAQLLPAILRRLEGRPGDEECRVGTLTSRHMTTAAYLAAAKLATKLGDSGLAWVTADRAMRAATESEHPALAGVAAYQLGCALLRSGDLANAESTVSIGAEDLATAGYADCHREEILSAHGCLLLLLAVIAARRGDGKAAQIALGEAGRLADELGRDGNWLWTAFGPINVAIHQLSVQVSLGDVTQAIRLGATIDTDGLPAVLLGRRSRVHLDLAWAAAGQADDALAVLHLLEAERIAPQAVSRHVSAQRLLDTLVRRERREATPGLRALAARASMLQ